MEKVKVILLLVCISLAVTAISCNKAKSCTCYLDISNEVVDSAVWAAAGEPFYMKSGEPHQPKTFRYDTLLQSGACESLDYYDSVGTLHPDEGLCLHTVNQCFEE